GCVGGHPWSENPTLHVHAPPGSRQQLIQGGDELLAGDRLECEPLQVFPQESIELRATYGLLEGSQKEVTLFVRNGGERLIRIHARQLSPKAAELRAVLEALHGLVQRAASERRVQSARLAAFQRLENASLGENGEALVQREVFSRCIGNQIPGPGVRQLVRDHAHQRAISRQDGRGEKSQPRVLHSSVRERKRHGEDVEALPQIGAKKRLRGAEHRLNALKLPCRAIDDRRLCPDAGTLAEVAKGQVTHRESEQVRRNRLSGFVGLHCGSALLLSSNKARRHQCAKPLRNGESSPIA